MTYNENIKQYIDKWRTSNREKYNNYCATQMKKQYEKNKEIKNRKDLERYYLNKELKKFRNILLD